MSGFSLLPRHSAFGLDIGQETIKFAFVRKGAGDVATLEAYGKAALPAESIQHGAISNSNAVAEAIRSLYHSHGLHAGAPPFAVCSLPERESFVRIIQMPLMPEAQIGDALQWEIEGHIPVSKDEVYYDWSLVDTVYADETKITGDTGTDHLDILVAATLRTIADSYAEAVRQAGIMPVAFEIESQAVVRAVVREKTKDGAVLILDLGGTKTTFIIYAAGALRFTTIIPVPNEFIVKAITGKVHVTPDEAYKLIQEVGLDPKQLEGKILDAAMPILSDMLEQIRKYMDYYETNVMPHVAAGKKIDKIYLTGGGANLKGLPTYLSANLHIPVEVVNPWANIGTGSGAGKKKSPKPALRFKDALGYTTAFGLAIRGAQQSWT